MHLSAYYTLDIEHWECRAKSPICSSSVFWGRCIHKWTPVSLMTSVRGVVCARCCRFREYTSFTPRVVIGRCTTEAKRKCHLNRIFKDESEWVREKGKGSPGRGSKEGENPASGYRSTQGVNWLWRGSGGQVLGSQLYHAKEFGIDLEGN